MTEVKDKIRLCTPDGKCEVEALFDTGAKASYLNDELGKRLNFKAFDQPKEIYLAVEDKKAEAIGFSSDLNLEIAGCEMPFPQDFVTIKNLTEAAIVGLDVIEKYDISLDTKRGKAKLKECPPRLKIV